MVYRAPVFRLLRKVALKIEICSSWTAKRVAADRCGFLNGFCIFGLVFLSLLRCRFRQLTEAEGIMVMESKKWKLLQYYIL